MEISKFTERIARERNCSPELIRAIVTDCLATLHESAFKQGIGVAHKARQHIAHLFGSDYPYVPIAVTADGMTILGYRQPIYWRLGTITRYHCYRDLRRESEGKHALNSRL